MRTTGAVAFQRAGHILEFRENPRINHAEAALGAAISGQKLGIGGEFDAGVFVLVVRHEAADEFQIG
jgi:hypothetical protein